ncbi:MAG: ribosomal subunit interface protein [Lentimonas sp.]|jgi:ribosomal subunit interface protein
MEVGDSLSDHIKEHMERNVTKYFDKAINANVNFTKQADKFKVNIVVNEGVKNGIVIKSDANALDPYVCFNEAMEKASTQLRKYNDKIKNYRKNHGGIKNIEINDQGYDALKYIISTSDSQKTEKEEFLAVNQEDKNLKVITEKNTDIEELTVDEAIMKMDLSDLPALVFINSKNNRLNVVYHRKDGNISWIDPIK